MRLLGLSAARIADSQLALLVLGRRLLDAQPVRPRCRAAVLDHDERPEQLHRVGVELRLPAGERRAQVEVSRPGRYALLVVALPLLAPSRALGVICGGGTARVTRVR